MTRTPMEMSAYRMARRHASPFPCVNWGDWVFGKRGRGSEDLKAHKLVAAAARSSRVLHRRIARYGLTVYE